MGEQHINNIYIIDGLLCMKKGYVYDVKRHSMRDKRDGIELNACPRQASRMTQELTTDRIY